ncbi:UNVERIFIED_CONTAM: hypothetical protein RMT77_010973 [Armadillidium vulgare]|nr:hypothetical protein Avbf_12800 [Armadillidium vulgare]
MDHKSHEEHSPQLHKSHEYHVMNSDKATTSIPDLHSGHDTSSSSDSHDSLHLGFHGGINELILFQGLYIETLPAFIFTCVVLFAVAFLLEVMRYYGCKFEENLKLYKEEKQNLIPNFISVKTSINIDEDKCNNTSDNNTNDKNLEEFPLPSSSVDCCKKKKKTSEIKSWLILGLYYSSNYILGTFLMLIAMNYNSYLVVAMCLGVTAGKLFALHLKTKVAPS